MSDKLATSWVDGCLNCKLCRNHACWNGRHCRHAVLFNLPDHLFWACVPLLPHAQVCTPESIQNPPRRPFKTSVRIYSCCYNTSLVNENIFLIRNWGVKCFRDIDWCCSCCGALILFCQIDSKLPAWAKRSKAGTEVKMPKKSEFEVNCSAGIFWRFFNHCDQLLKKLLLAGWVRRNFGQRLLFLPILAYDVQNK